jgi:3-phosphoshikimate 1-carboxyvinyltransferase
MSSSIEPGPDAIVVRPLAGPFDCALRVPGSKSLTNRFAVLAAIARGRSRLRRPLRADDTNRLFRAIDILGAKVEDDGEDVLVSGCDGRLPGGGSVDLGDGGTPTRFVLALATLAAERTIVDGSPRMRERPVDEGIALLRELGADLRGTARRSEGPDGVVRVVDEALPVVVEPTTDGRLRGGWIDVGRTQSSQFLSALLLVAPTMRHPLTLAYADPPTSGSYLELTAAALGRVGVPVHEERRPDGSLRLQRVEPRSIEPFDVLVEPDASSCVYPAIAAAMVPGARVRLEGLGRSSRQPDLRMIDALATMGARVAWHDEDRDRPWIEIEGTNAFRGGVFDASLWPDAAVALAAACGAASSPSTIRGLATLAVKESDRITALATELTKLGCRCVATSDALMIDPTKRHGRPATIATYRDHRIAMSFACLGLVRPGLSISDPGCVAKSWPEFWSMLDALRTA